MTPLRVLEWVGVAAVGLLVVLMFIVAVKSVLSPPRENEDDL